MDIELEEFYTFPTRVKIASILISFFHFWVQLFGHKVANNKFF